MASSSIFEFENCLVLWWHERMTLAGVEACVRQGERMMSRGKISLLTIIDVDVDINAPADARKAMAAFLSRNEARISAAAIIYEASGFKATAVRSIITAINISSRSAFPNKVFSEFTSAVRWMASTSGAPPAFADRLVRACAARSPLLAG